MSMVGFPLLLIPLAIYNIIVFLMPGVSLGDPLVTLPLMSGAAWPVTLGDILLAIDAESPRSGAVQRRILRVSEPAMAKSPGGRPTAQKNRTPAVKSAAALRSRSTCR